MYKIECQEKLAVSAALSTRSVSRRAYYMMNAVASYKCDNDGAVPSQTLAESLGKKFSEMQTAMLTKFTYRSSNTKNYKDYLTANKMNTAAVSQTIFHELFGGGGLSYYKSNYCLVIVAAIHSLAQELAIDCYQRGELSKLLETIEFGRKLVLPNSFSMVFNRLGQNYVPTMDICSARDLQDLAYLLGVCMPSAVYNILFWPALTEEDHPDRPAILCAYSNRAKIKKKLFALISVGFRKRAERAFIATAAAQYEFVIEYLFEHKYSTSLDKIEPFGNMTPWSNCQHRALPTTPTIKSEIGREVYSFHLEATPLDKHVDAVFNACADEMLDILMGRNDKSVEELAGHQLEDINLALSGFLFLVSDNYFWSTGWLMYIIAENIVFLERNRAILYIDNVARLGCSVSDSKELRTRNKGIIADVLNLFSAPNEKLKGDGEGGLSLPLTNEQVLVSAGLLVTNTARLNYNKEFVDNLCDSLSTLGHLPASIVSAAATVSLMNKAMLLHQNTVNEDDRAELMQRALEAEEREAAAQNRIKELEAQLAGKTKIIEEQNEKLFEASRNCAAKEREIAAVESDKQELRQHFDELLDIVAQLDSDEDEPQLEDPAMFDREVLRTHRVVLCGGTDRFAAQIEDELPEISAYPASQLTPTSALKNADAVFVQASYISHGHYYPIRDICKTNRIPLYFYRTRGIKAVARLICKTMNNQISQQSK